MTSGTQVQEFWREEIHQHINWKELKAAIATVKSLAKPGNHIQLTVDNTVAFTYLAKGGGRMEHLNNLVRPFFQWCITHKLQLSLQWVPSEEQKADHLSRMEDNGDYTLNRELFLWVKTHLKQWVNPAIDMFASPGNCQLPCFVSRWPNFQAKATDALKCPLQDYLEVYANPSWTIIQSWLHRLQINPHLKCLMICP